MLKLEPQIIMECNMTMTTETVWLEEPTDIGCMEPEDVSSDPSDHALVEPKQELIECIPQSLDNKNIKVEVDVEDCPESVVHSSDSRLRHDGCNIDKNPVFTYRTDNEEFVDCDSTNDSYTCPVCSKIFGKRAYLKRHVKIHNKMREQQYDRIRNNFNALSAMKPTETNPEDKCSLINGQKKLRNAADLKNHNSLHIKKRNFYCQEQDCGRSFVMYNHLIEHMERHKLPTFFECEVCKKKFSHRGSLKTHLVVHTGQRKYECNVCLKRFTLLGNLTKHKYIHTGEKRFECPICPKRYSQKCSLDRHMTVH